MPSFRPYPLGLIYPSLDQSLMDVLIDLEKLREKRLEGTTPPPIFHQLKHLFHILESLGSTRIEGNHTTLTEYVESRLGAEDEPDGSPIDEILNVENAMRYLDEHFHSGDEITHRLIRELHQLTVKDLPFGEGHEGDSTPGKYREQPVGISQSEHIPPPWEQVRDVYMNELVAFVNAGDSPKYDLLKVALAHHRFVWVHPFKNGNGRVVRLLTYAMLIKYGFEVDVAGRILNPTAVFCQDRDRYNEMLALADNGTEDALSTWCEYVLAGIRDEVNKVDRLLDYDNLKAILLRPALTHCTERSMFKPLEARALEIAINRGVIQAADLDVLDVTARQRTALVQSLKSQKLIAPIKEGARTYIPNFIDSPLMRGVIPALRNAGFTAALDT